MPRHAVLLGSGPRVVLTIARSLHRRGIPVIVALTSADDRWTRSRAVSRVERLRGSTAERGAQLERLVRESDASWVAPCSDTALLLLADCYERIAALAHVASPPPATVAAVLDKARTIAVAREAGVPVPREFAIATRADLEAHAALPFPLVAKPADKSRRARHDFKVRHFESRSALVAAFARDATFGEGLVFQEFVPGDGVGVEVLMDHGGEALAVFQHRRLRELPASGGVAVAAVAETVDPTLREHAVRLLRALGWRGVAMVEFRHEPRDGRAALMEVNGRFWGSLALPVHVGYDFPYWQWQLDHGERPVVPPSYRAGTRLRWGTGDLLRLEGLLAADANVTAADRGRAVAAFLGDFRPGVRPALWSWSDPLPAMAEAAHASRRVVRRLASAVVRGVTPESLLDDVRLARRLGGERGRIYLRTRLLRRIGSVRQRLPDPWQPRHVLFICHGNIMRSAFAGELLRRRLAEASVSSVVVESAGVHAKPGREAHPRVRALAPEFEVDLSTHGARLVDERMIAAADTIFVMDDRNVAHLLARFPEARAKTFYLGGVRLAAEYAAREIADPYEADAAAARAMMEDVCACVGVLAEALVSRADDRNVVGVA